MHSLDFKQAAFYSYVISAVGDSIMNFVLFFDRECIMFIPKSNGIFFITGIFINS